MSAAVVFRPWKGSVEVQLPYRPGSANYDLLRAVCPPRTRITWDRPRRAFLISRDHVGAVVEGLAGRLPRVEVYLEGTDKSTCVAECWEASPATRWQCICACAGLWHGNGQPPGIELRPGLIVWHEHRVASYVLGTSV